MRICLDVRYKTRSGASSYINNIVPEIIKIGRGNSFIIIKTPGQNLEFEKMADEIIISPSRPELFVIWDMLFLPFILKRKKVDVYHGMKAPGPYFTPCKSICTIHSITTKNYDGSFPVSWKTYLYYKLIGDRVSVKADRLIAVSNFLKNYVVKLYGVNEKKVDVVENGVGEEFGILDGGEVGQVLAKMKYPDNYVLCVGNITPVKNHITAVKAFAEIANEIPDSLVILGGRDNSYFSDVKSEIEKFGIKGRVITPGFVDGNNLVALMNGAKAIILPSITEGCPVTMLEAFKCGLPVIASKRAGMWDIGKDSALFVDDPYDYVGFSEKLLAILSSKDLRNEFREKGIKKSMEHKWSDAAKHHLDTYNKAVQNLGM